MNSYAEATGPAQAAKYPYETEEADLGPGRQGLRASIRETSRDVGEDHLMKTSTRLLLLALAVGMLAAGRDARAAGPNLLPNPSFEESVLEPAEPLEGQLPQPLLPTGWAFEGIAGLFDHTPNAYHSGARAIAISIPASTPQEYCIDQAGGCIDSPVNPARDAARPVYSMTPFWRTLEPVAVQQGATYELSVWTSLEIVTEGEGAITQVRWLDANGLTISGSAGPSRRQRSIDPDSIPFTFIEGIVKAPAGAVAAHVMLGHSDDAWIGQVRFDDVSFRKL